MALNRVFNYDLQAVMDSYIMDLMETLGLSLESIPSENGKEKIVKYGARGYKDYTQHKDPNRRKNFHARHNCDEKKSKLTAGWWACNKLW